MKHPYYEILIAIAEGKEIQWRNGNGKWITQSSDAVLICISEGAFEAAQHRIKPATITINGVECEAPVNDGGYHLGICGGESKVVNFATEAARDAAYAELIKPFENAS